MNKIADLLTAFGFTAKDAKTIAEKAHENGLDPADVQAWIDEARISTSLHNPLGFVRRRIQDGDRLSGRLAAGCRHTSRRTSRRDRRRYRDWQPTQAKTITLTCMCGRIVYATHFCPQCNLCPTCCECEPADQDKE